MKKDNLSLTNLTSRALSPTPSFWKKIQKIALIVAGISATILSGGIALPAVVITIAGYAAVGAAAVATVSQFTFTDKAAESPEYLTASDQK